MKVRLSEKVSKLLLHNNNCISFKGISTCMWNENHLFSLLCLILLCEAVSSCFCDTLALKIDVAFINFSYVIHIYTCWHLVGYIKGVSYIHTSSLQLVKRTNTLIASMRALAHISDVIIRLCTHFVFVQ